MRLNVAIGLAFLLGLCVAVIFDTLGAIPKGGSKIYGLVGAICAAVIGLQSLGLEAFTAFEPLFHMAVGLGIRVLSNGFG